MLKIVHNILVNLDTSIVTTKPPIDIHQGDSRSHVLRFQLCTSTSPFKRIDPDTKFKIEFFDGDTLIKSSDVVIENDVRGLVRYVLTSNITKRPARYTTYLKMVTRDCDNDDVVLAKASFVVTVSEAHDYCPKSSEVILTKDEYEEIQNHIIDSQIHLSKNDRKVLDEMTVNMDAVLRMINESASWIEIPKCKCIKCSCKNCTQESKYLYFSQLPQGKLIFKKDMILKDKNEVDHFIKSPAYGLHSVGESGVHSLTMFSSEDIVQYDESATTCDYRSLKSTLHSHENKEVLDTYTKTMPELIKQVNQYTDGKISETDRNLQNQIKNLLTDSQALVYKGVLNSDAEVPENYKAGWLYKIGSEGIYQGHFCNLNDYLVAISSTPNDHSIEEAEYRPESSNEDWSRISGSSSSSTWEDMSNS